MHFSFCVADKPSYPYVGLAKCARRNFCNSRRLSECRARGVFQPAAPGSSQGAVRAQFQIPNTFCPIPNFTSFTPLKIPPVLPRWASQKLRGKVPKAAQTSNFYYFWSTSCPSQNSSKINTLPKLKKLSPKAPPNSILKHFWIHFGTHVQRLFRSFTKKANTAPTL